jgi:hypothetical protein
MSETSGEEVQRLRASVHALLKVNSAMLQFLVQTNPEIRSDVLKVLRDNRLEVADPGIAEAWDQEIEEIKHGLKPLSADAPYLG